MVHSCDSLRKMMVEGQLRRRGVSDVRVLDAFLKVSRHEFIPEGLRGQAYEDHPVQIGSGQTISQPYIVAAMVEALSVRPSDVVLEVGSGSGYAAAILSLLARAVVAVERVRALAERSSETLGRLGFGNVMVVHADGLAGSTLGRDRGLDGSPALAPPGRVPTKTVLYDKILVSARASEVPRSLFGQLKEGGIMVIPVGDAGFQELTRIRKSSGRMVSEVLLGCVFVPLQEGVC